MEQLSDLQPLMEDLFRNGASLRVTFTKTDGTERVINCTTNIAVIPQEKHPKGTGSSPESTKRVFDIDKQEWRSFRWENVIKFTTLNNNL